MTASAPKPFAPKRPLPSQPSLEHLRKEAKTRLAWLRGRDPCAQLAEAQRAVAGAYGFRSWRALKAAVEKQAVEELRACPGFYRHDPARIANIFLRVGLDGGNLTLQGLNGALMTLQRQADGRFAAPGLTARYGFERNAAGAVIAMIVDVDGRRSRLERISEIEAETIRTANCLAQAEQARPRNCVTVPPERLLRHVGHYASGFGLSLEVSVENGSLFSQVTGQQKLPLQAESEDDFFLTVLPVQIRFRAEDDRTMAMAVHQNGAITFLNRVSAEEAAQTAAATAQRFAEQIKPRVAVSLPAEILPLYAGRYRVDHAREMIVDAADGRLFAQITGQARYEIYPEAKNRFFWTVVAAQVSFITGADGAVTHAILHQAGREAPLSRLPEDATAAAPLPRRDSSPPP